MTHFALTDSETIEGAVTITVRHPSGINIAIDKDADALLENMLASSPAFTEAVAKAMRLIIVKTLGT